MSKHDSTQTTLLRAKILEVLSRTDQLGALAITTAMVRLYARQTQDERETHNTRHQNGRGFNSADAKNGTYYAHYALGATKFHPRGRISPEQWDAEVVNLRANLETPIRLLSGRYLEKARRMAITYINQLVEEAQAK